MESKAKVGGILAIISGCFGFFQLFGALVSVFMFRSVFTLVPDEPYTSYGGGPPDEFLTAMTIFYSAIGIFFAIVGILGIIGGIFALKRRRWGLALAGAIAGAFTFFPCGIPAIIFVSMAQPEFSSPAPPPPV